MLEILAPSGNEECAEVAIGCGANAIYLGYTAFSARDGAGNFNDEALKRIICKAHFAGVKIYVAMNTLVKTAETDVFLETLLRVWNMGADAIILQDIFLGKYVHALYPQIVLHLSTQAGICTEAGARLAKEYGFSRVILARETPLSEIEKITNILETEVFVQGALCTCFSGQCYFSSFAGGNSGNRGRCKQPCRKKYSYNRAGFEEKAYALSLSDLSVGEDVNKLIDAGVVSFKIEGRMRRKEYVGAAIRYYKAVLQGNNSHCELSDLKRTYNRGNYTKGLAFGQDKRFLSRAVQGHIGEKVGVVKVENGKFAVESAFHARQGDAFKILRDGIEVGGAAYAGKYARGFFLFSKLRLKNGDSVFVTTDNEVNERVLKAEQALYPVRLKLRFVLGEEAYAEGDGVKLKFTQPLQKAINGPLTSAELMSNFSKTDGMPIKVEFESVETSGDVFLPKSALNAFRREFYALLAQKVAVGERAPLTNAWSIPKLSGCNSKLAVISDDFSSIKCDVAIYKPKSYSEQLPQSFVGISAEKYLYLPPFHTSADLAAVKRLIAENRLDGVYADGYDGLILAKELGCKLFAGTGFNLTNPIAIVAIYDDVEYYAISKELSVQEGAGLLTDKAFLLSSGDVKIMDLCYCPFGKTCNRCDRRDHYILTDESGREFSVRRYQDISGACRFEVFNCASLIGCGIKNAGLMIEVTAQTNKKEAVLAAYDEERQKTLYTRYTSGHSKNGVL